METNTENINDSGTVTVTIRLKADLHEAVKQEAEAQARSLTKQIEWSLERNLQIRKRLERAAVPA